MEVQVAGAKKVKCQHCGHDVARFMRFCPGCGGRQTWDRRRVGSDWSQDTLPTPFNAWAQAMVFSYCPWTGIELWQPGNKNVVRARGFTLDEDCRNSECTGRLERYMSYCPTCGTGETGSEPQGRRWSAAEPGKRWLLGRQLDVDCGDCGWETAWVWRHCPWCGSESRALSPVMRNLLALRVDRVDETQWEWFVRLVRLGAEYDDYSLAAAQLRRVLESSLHELARRQRRVLKPADWRADLPTIIKTINAAPPASRPSIPGEAESVGMTAVRIGNRGAHPGDRVSLHDLEIATSALQAFVSKLPWPNASRA